MENKEWIFSGLGVFVLSLIIGFIIWLFKRKMESSKVEISNSKTNEAIVKGENNRIKQNTYNSNSNKLNVEGKGHNIEQK